MGAQNDSLHSWAFEWLTAEDTLILMGEGSFPESYQCGDNRDIALGDFDGTGQDEVVIAWTAPTAECSSHSDHRPRYL